MNCNAFFFFLVDLVKENQLKTEAKKSSIFLILVLMETTCKQGFLASEMKTHLGVHISKGGLDTSPHPKMNIKMMLSAS